MRQNASKCLLMRALRPVTGVQDKEELQRAMANKVPAKIDIGPIYNVDPQRRKAYTGK